MRHLTVHKPSNFGLIALDFSGDALVLSHDECFASLTLTRLSAVGVLADLLLAFPLEVGDGSEVVADDGHAEFVIHMAVPGLLVFGLELLQSAQFGLASVS
jgi:hypothetical protein